ncbi:hypothetical protein ACNHUS_24480 [Actinomycetes bacterium M1A6_2h]
MRKVVAALVLLVALLGVSTGIASANPTSTFTTVTVPSPYPWEGPLTLGVSGSGVEESTNQGPVVAKLAVNVQPPTTDPLYGQQFRLLTFGTHTEIRWRNTATGVSGTAVSDKSLQYPAGGAVIDTGIGTVEYTVIVTVGAFVPQINPQTVTASGVVQVDLRR